MQKRIMSLSKIILLAALSIRIALHASPFQPTELVDFVKKSIDNAKNGISKLSPDILGIEGMSGSKGRHLLNNLCSLPGANYLEIGVWKGSTFISAVYANERSLASAIAIDNWSEFGGPQSEFLKNMQKFLLPEKAAFYNTDCFVIDKQNTFLKPVNIYFYDGNHTVESHKKAFTYFNDILDDLFIAVVDDWAWDLVKSGTKSAFEELHYQVLFEETLPSYVASDKENWWNGLYVAVIRK